MAQLVKGTTINGYQAHTTDIHKHEVHLPLAGFYSMILTYYDEVYGTDFLFTPANYVNYNFYFEVNGKSNDGYNVDFQLYNKTDALSIAVVSTTSNVYVRLRSAVLTMPGAEKTLCLRMQAGTDTAAICTIARLVLMPA
ncbi:MAG TPA: hypothetical protein DCY27_10705 [Desulfobacterales bacterium]|nr:hypothetical protein [Desulfobacterales bacterium]